MPEVGVKIAVTVTEPVLGGVGNVQVPVVDAIAIAVHEGRPPPPTKKSTDPAIEVVMLRTGA